MCVYVYRPGTQMNFVLNGKGLLFGGFKPKNRGQTGSRPFAQALKSPLLSKTSQRNC